MSERYNEAMLLIATAVINFHPQMQSWSTKLFFRH